MSLIINPMLIVAALVVVAVVLIAVAVLVSHSHKKNAVNPQNTNVSEGAKSAEAGEASGGKDKESSETAKTDVGKTGKSSKASEPSKSDESGKVKTGDTAKNAQKTGGKKAKGAQKLKGEKGSGGKSSAGEKSSAKNTTEKASRTKSAKKTQKANDKKGSGNKPSSQDKASAKSATKESSEAKKGATKPDSSAASASKEEAPAKSEVETPEPKASRGVRLKEKLSKSSNPFGRVLFNILAKDQLSESDWEDVEDTLLLADVGSEASEKLVDELRNDARITGTSDPKAVREALRSKLIDLVDSQPDRALNADKPDAKKPSVIIMVGVNGTGKTTTAGKLARLFVSEGKSVMLAAADTFRAAAADQLETWGQKVGVPVVRSEKEGGDPASVAFDASKQAKEQNVDVLIIDTAGRLQNKANLMDELGKIRRVTEKNLPVDEVLLVLDAVTGQNGMAQAKVFAEAIGITGVVLSKLDGSAKGGIVISVQQELGVPVKLVGLGEGPDDLAPFDPEGFVDGILA